MADDRATLAQQLTEDDAIDVFDDTNSAYAAAFAAADLLMGWNSYDAPYQQKHAHEYQPYDVDEVIRFLQAWKAKGCPSPEGMDTKVTWPETKATTVTNVLVRFERGRDDVIGPTFGPYEYLQVTYKELTTSVNNGDPLAYLDDNDGDWHLTADPTQHFSDFILMAGEDTPTPPTHPAKEQT